MFDKKHKGTLEKIVLNIDANDLITNLILLNANNKRKIRENKKQTIFKTNK